MLSMLPRMHAVVGDVYLAMKDQAKAKEWYEKTVAMPSPPAAIADRECQVRTYMSL
jgi:predicted negative regulator of RcsB-dependent stress response